MFPLSLIVPRSFFRVVICNRARKEKKQSRSIKEPHRAVNEAKIPAGTPSRFNEYAYLLVAKWEKNNLCKDYSLGSFRWKGVPYSGSFILSGLATVKEDNFWSYAHLLIFVFLTIWLLTSKKWHTRYSHKLL